MTVTWSSEDALSGIETSEGNIASGAKLDTAAVGPHTLEFTVVDKTGNVTVTKITYNVVYVFSGFLKPLDHKKTWKAGSTIPVKFNLKDAKGKYVTRAEARLYFAKVENGTVGLEESAYTRFGAIFGNKFWYSRCFKQYIFNMSTWHMEKGTYQLRVDLGDGTVNTITITLK